MFIKCYNSVNKSEANSSSDKTEARLWIKNSHKKGITKEGKYIMKRTGKLTAALLALFAITAIYSICDKDESKTDEIAAYGMNAQAIEIIPEAVPVIEEAVPQKNVTIKAAVVDTAMAKSAGNINEVADVRVSTETKNTNSVVEFASAAQTTDVCRTTEEQKDNSVQENKPEETVSSDVEEETTVDYSNRLAGKWQATIVDVGFSINLDYEFAQDGTLYVDFSESNYNTLVERIERLNMSAASTEGVTESEENVDGITLQDGIVQVPVYKEMKAKLSKTGTWELNGNTLTVTVNGESATADINFAEGADSFVLNYAEEAVSLTR